MIDKDIQICYTVDTNEREVNKMGYKLEANINFSAKENKAYIEYIRRDLNTGCGEFLFCEVQDADEENAGVDKLGRNVVLVPINTITEVG